MIWEFFINFYRLYRYMLFLIFIFPYMNFRRMISVYVYFQLKLENAESEEEMMEEWRKMNVQKIFLQNASKTELKYIFQRMIEKDYKRLMMQVLENPRMKFPDYYEMLVLLEREGWEDVRHHFLQLPRVKNHMQRFVKKKSEKMRNQIGFHVIPFGNNMFSQSESQMKQIETEEECAFCLDLLSKREKIIECKTCRLKLDIRCWKQWIREEKNNCLMCRSIWFPNRRTKELMKWTEYASIT